MQPSLFPPLDVVEFAAEMTEETGAKWICTLWLGEWVIEKEISE